MSQETCLDNIHVLGRGVPVGAVAIPHALRCPESRRVTLAFAPNSLGLSHVFFKTSSSTTSTIAVATLGTPRIGPRRELKLALESFWSGATDGNKRWSRRAPRFVLPTGRARKSSASP